MTFERERASAFFRRWREAGAAFILGLIALRTIWQGGWFFVPLGIALLALAAGWAAIALRRMRFDQPVEAPGVVEVDEGQVGFLGPTFGGFVSVRDLAEIRLVTLYGRKHWRLKQVDGQALLIPVAAQGADRLFEAFSALPGFDSHALAQALGGSSDLQVVWRRPPLPAAERAALT